MKASRNLFPTSQIFLRPSFPSPASKSTRSNTSRKLSSRRESAPVQLGNDLSEQVNVSPTFLSPTKCTLQVGTLLFLVEESPILSLLSPAICR